ncbi:MAG: WG repeat-containing protein [Clostridia bacterium]|nr:WG repeat-containing protein [Clostridia bacterium]
MKRCALCAFLCLLLAAAPALGEVLPVFVDRPEDGVRFGMLLRDDGTKLTPEDTYGYIYRLTPEDTPEASRLYSVAPKVVEPSLAGEITRPDDDYFVPVALMDAAGQLKTDYAYADLTWAGEDRLIFRTSPDRRCGVMDAEGHIVLPPEYANIVPTGSGGWLALRLGNSAPEYDVKYPIVAIGPDGVSRDTGLHADQFALGSFSDGICMVDGVQEFDGGAIFVDEEGRQLFGARFDDAYDFCGALARVTVADRRGLIDRNGRFVVEPGYDSIIHDDTLDGGVFIAERSGVFHVYDDSGTLLLDLPVGEGAYGWMPNPAMFCISGSGRSDIYALDGTRLGSVTDDRDVNCWFSYECEEMPQRLIVSQGEWPFEAARLTTLDGEPVGGFFQALYGLCWADGRGLYRVESWRNYVDPYGSFVSDWRSLRSGLCDQDGQMVLDLNYETLEMLAPDRFWVTQGNRTGLIDMDGRWLYAYDVYQNLLD